MKILKAHLLATGCMLVSLSLPAWAATNLRFGEPQQAGSISSAGQFNSYTFTAVAGDVVDFTMTVTSGSLSPKIQVYNSEGTSIGSANNEFCNGSTIELNTLMLTAAGTYTVDVSDCSDTNTGDYELYAQSTNRPVGAVNLPFSPVQTGNIGLAAQSNTYTFSATVNDEIDFTMTATSGSLSPRIRLYNGLTGKLLSDTSNEFCNGSTIELNTFQIPATGAYTVLVADCSDANTGKYDIYTQRTNHPPGAVNLPFGQTQTGAIGSAAQSNTYTFSANTKDVVDFTMVTTSGTLSPRIRLYSPTGALLNDIGNEFCNGSTIELNTVTLSVSGTYTLLVGDCSDTYTGKYDLYSQRTNNASGAATLLFGPTQTGLISSAAESNSYIFSGSENEVVDFTMATTTGSLSPRIRLYSPTGALLNDIGNEFCNGSTIELNTVKLPASGAYTVLVGDCSDTHTGNYVLYAQSTNNPFSPAPVLWGQVQSSKIASAAQSNTYTFAGVVNNTIDLTIVATSGNLSPRIRLYNPAGALVSDVSNEFCNGSTIELNSVKLPTSGDYTMLVGDCSDTYTGNYNLSSQCFGACPVMPAIIWPTPAAVTFCTGLGSKQLDATANVAGSFTYSPSAGTLLSLGPHILSTTFTPTDKTDYSTARDFVEVSVVQARTSTALSSSLNPSIVGESVTFKATLTSSCGAPPGTVTFKNGAATLGIVALSSGEATFSTSALAPGAYSITAVYGGSTEFLGSTSPVLTQTVKQAPTSTSLASSLNPSTFGQSVSFTATVKSSGGTPTGTVTFKNGSSVLATVTLSSGKAIFSTSALSVGRHSITAVYGGSADFLGSTSPVLTQTVKQAPTSTSVASSLNPSTFGQSVTFTATVKSSGGTPTGTVTFKDGSSTFGIGALSGGKATFSTSALSAGSHSIAAVYGGSTDFLGSTSPALTQIVKQAASSTSVTSSLNPSTFGQSVTFTATVKSSGGTPPGMVTFKNGSSTLGAGTLSSGKATFTTSTLSKGTHSVTAEYGGSADFLSSTSTALGQVVN